MAKQKSSYTVKREGEYVDVLWDGFISQKMALDCNAKIIKAAQAFISQGKPVLLRFHAVNIPVKTNRDAANAALRLFKSGTVPIQRFVIWGAAPFIARVYIHVALELFSSKVKIRYIEDETAATAWLLEGANVT